MKILAVSQYYWPEPFNVSDICEELAKRGHEITVLTGIPNYPEGRVYPGYESGNRRIEEKNGVKILRSWLLPRRTGAINRLLNYESFSRAASRRTRQLSNDFDVVLAFEISPVMSANPAIAYCKKNKTPLLLYVIDIWPECLLSGGIKRDSFIYNHYKKVSTRIYSEGDVIAVTSPSFKTYISRLLNREINVVNLPQYAEDIFKVDQAEKPNQYKSDSINLTFAGNIGAAQSVETIVKAANLVKAHKNIAFHIVGYGSELENCKKLAASFGLTNVIFHGRQPLHQMPNYHFVSDAMVATFSNSPMLAYTLPRKIQSYMAAGRPIIGSVAGEAKSVIEEAGCGLYCDPEDYEALAQKCIEFSKMPKEQREQMGKLAKKYYEEHFSRKVFFEILEAQLNNLKGTKHHGC